ncbi:MAG: hypothetical protein RIR11_1541 [Bacteroidota bacterium]
MGIWGRLGSYIPNITVSHNKIFQYLYFQKQEIIPFFGKKAQSTN